MFLYFNSYTTLCAYYCEIIDIHCAPRLAILPLSRLSTSQNLLHGPKSSSKPTNPLPKEIKSKAKRQDSVLNGNHFSKGVSDTLDFDPDQRISIVKSQLFGESRGA
jgi:hypothetical protein